ncbi:hypothetical protein CCS01_25670 [Rhodopila globiformis]|uniref:Uncharacterized protein n=1 Tax=Rhodopila globiformis TaxID=1071 RepID=A0A2S6N0D9_RHOGL|nr:hypothetical protein CCS01_25670 [Rhodopila globiformis]
MMIVNQNGRVRPGNWEQASTNDLTDGWRWFVRQLPGAAEFREIVVIQRARAAVGGVVLTKRNPTQARWLRREAPKYTRLPTLLGVQLNQGVLTDENSIVNDRVSGPRWRVSRPRESVRIQTTIRIRNDIKQRNRLIAVHANRETMIAQMDAL